MKNKKGQTPEEVLEQAAQEKKAENVINLVTSPISTVLKNIAKFVAGTPADIISEEHKTEAIVIKTLQKHGLLKSSHPKPLGDAMNNGMYSVINMNTFPGEMRLPGKTLLQQIKNVDYQDIPRDIQEMRDQEYKKEVKEGEIVPEFGCACLSDKRTIISLVAVGFFIYWLTRK